MSWVSRHSKIWEAPIMDRPTDNNCSCHKGKAFVAVIYCLLFTITTFGSCLTSYFDFFNFTRGSQ